MKTLLNTLQALVLVSVLLTFAGIFTKHIVVVQVKEPQVVNVVGENHETLFQWVTGYNVSYYVAFSK